jgi:hypothetical protein
MWKNIGNVEIGNLMLLFVEFQRNNVDQDK